MNKLIMTSKPDCEYKHVSHVFPVIHSMSPEEHAKNDKDLERRFREIFQEIPAEALVAVNYDRIMNYEGGVVSKVLRAGWYEVSW